MSKMLSICIPTVVGREKEYSRLLDILTPQLTDEVELVVIKDNKEISIGKKRQNLYEQCTGVYAVQIDDDDYVPSDYVVTVLAELKKEPDCIGYLEEVIDGSKRLLVCHSDRYKDWANNVDGFYCVRTIFYKDVIKTSIAKQVGIKDLRYGEDHDFSRRLKASGLLKEEAFIDKIMYFYTTHHLTSNQHKERYGIK